jgi:dolichol-phosphate mannosyltransferase
VITMNIVVMLPTYNESENIEHLIHALFQLNIAHLEILVVDDHSPDGTWKIVERLMKKYPFLHLLLRTGPRGRGLAGVAGFLKALEMGADIVVEMDADFSHNPSSLPSLLSALDSADMVVGSRAVKGGSDFDRPFLRQLLTVFANLYIRLLLGVRVKDCNSGYRVFRRNVLTSIDLEHITSHGPGIIQEVLYRVHLHKFRIKEVPIAFVERKRGLSKLGFSHLYQGYILILKLRLLRLMRKL